MTADPSELLKCSFCGTPQKQTAKLVAGPGVYICDVCIRRLQPAADVADEAGHDMCSFCAKGPHQVEALHPGPGVFICSECVGLCNDIIDEEMPPADA